jgi:hypothetical protein
MGGSHREKPKKKPWKTREKPSFVISMASKNSMESKARISLEELKVASLGLPVFPLHL